MKHGQELFCFFLFASFTGFVSIIGGLNFPGFQSIQLLSGEFRASGLNDTSYSRSIWKLCYGYNGVSLDSSSSSNSTTTNSSHLIVESVKKCVDFTSYKLPLSCPHKPDSNKPIGTTDLAFFKTNICSVVGICWTTSPSGEDTINSTPDHPEDVASEMFNSIYSTLPFLHAAAYALLVITMTLLIMRASVVVSVSCAIFAILFNIIACIGTIYIVSSEKSRWSVNYPSVVTYGSGFYTVVLSLVFTICGALVLVVSVFSRGKESQSLQRRFLYGSPVKFEKVHLNSRYLQQIEMQLNSYFDRCTTRTKCRQIGLSDELYDEASMRYITEFRNLCVSDEPSSSSIIPSLSPQNIIDAVKNMQMDRTIIPDFIRFSSKFDNSKKIQNTYINIVKSADLRKPHQWYPEATRLKRKFILHLGPTNSGKTYWALKRLREASTGVYCGPLRLLAHEIYDRMNNEYNIPTRMMTGDDRREPPVKFKFLAGKEMPMVPGDVIDPTLLGDASHTSCTVEMVNCNVPVEVAVIDEIQMLNDPSRGWAWTRALLGIPAKEIHLCGAPCSQKLIENLLLLFPQKDIEIEVRNYERLTPLEVSKDLVSVDFSNIVPGDCVVAFSRRQIYDVKFQIEQKTNLRCAVIYGSLPPETRTEQARLFNDPDSGYDVLVASDAIGMGLNLGIKRVVFTTTEKFDGEESGKIHQSLIKQIAGRAGRYRVSGQNQSSLMDGAEDKITNVENENNKINQQTGLATTLSKGDFYYLKSCMSDSDTPLSAAGLLPPVELIEKFAANLPNSKDLSFSRILSHFQDFTIVDTKLFYLCNWDKSIEVIKKIDHLPLSIPDKYIFMNCPVKSSDPVSMYSFVEMAQAHNSYISKQRDSLKPHMLENMENTSIKTSDEQTIRGFCLFDLTCVQDFLFSRVLSRQKQKKIIQMFNEIKASPNTVPLKSEDNYSTRDTNLTDFFNKTLKTPVSSQDLTKYETLHQVTVMYIWLHYRYPSTFSSIVLAKEMKSRLEKEIDSGLDKIHFTKFIRKKMKNLNNLEKLDSLLFEAGKDLLIDSSESDKLKDPQWIQLEQTLEKLIKK